VFLSHLVAGETVLQMPLVLGAMSVFHSIPAEHVGTAGLELTPVRSPPLSSSCHGRLSHSTSLDAILDAILARRAYSRHLLLRLTSAVAAVHARQDLLSPDHELERR